MKVFPPFALDSENQCLWRGRERVVLAPKAFDVLRYLVDHAGQLVTQNQLLDSLWPETYVQPEVLRKYILDIRKALGDRPKDPIYIETFPKRGYQFVAAVTDSISNGALDSHEDPPASLVGRDRALAQLDNSLARCLEGQRQIVFVTGEAGIGKTSIIDQFEQQARRQPNLRVARGQCVEGFGGKEPYYPVLEALGQLVRDNRSAIAPTLAKHAPTWLIQFPALLEAGEKEALQREILGATRERMVREICEALEILTLDAPLVLILEDLHWVDHSTLDLISALARRRGPARLLLLATYRPVEIILSQSPLKSLKQDLLIHRLCAEISLERLTQADVNDYLTARFPRNDFPAGLAALIHRHSDGNPLFMTVIAEHMIQKGSLSEVSGIWKLADRLEDIDPGVPDTLQQMLEIQFEQLNPAEQRMMAIASVAGHRFSEWAVSAMLGADPSHVAPAFAALAFRHQFIKSAGVHELADGTTSPFYEFRHALYREFLYRRLSNPERRHLHRKLAERMEALCCPAEWLATELALHFEEGGEPGRAIRYLILSSHNAARRYARSEVISELQHALELVPEGQVELELEILQQLATSYYMLGDMLESGKTYQETARRAAAAELRSAQVNALIASARPTAFFDPEGCIAGAERAVEVAAGVNDPVLQARAQLLAARWRIVFNGWNQPDADTCADAMKTLTHAGDGSVSAKDLILYPQIQILQSDYRAALENAEASLPQLAEPQSMWEFLAALGARSLSLLGLGELGRAHRVMLQGIEMSDKNGNRPWIAVFRTQLAYLKFQAFDFEGSLADCESVVRPQEDHPGPLWTLAMSTAGLSELELGRIDRAIQRFEKVRDRATTPKVFLDWYWRIVAQYGFTSARLARGDLPNALKEADQFLAAALATADRSLQALAWSAKSQVLQMERDWKSAIECMDKALVTLFQLDAPLVAWRIHSAAGELFAQIDDPQSANYHRSQSAKIVLRLADSLEAGEPLRRSLLNHPPMRRLLAELSQSAR